MGSAWSLAALGYRPSHAAGLEELRSHQPEVPLLPARVVAQLGEQVRLAGVRSALGGPSGRLRHLATALGLPVVGDWVAVTESSGAEPAVIHQVLPRTSLLVRRAAGRRGDAQAVAANVDLFFIVTSANRDANPRRIERYLAAVWDSGARPIVVVNKTDQCEPGQLARLLGALEACAPGVPVLPVSAFTGDGLARLAEHTRPHADVSTVAFIGMSGVGKSSLVNALLGDDAQRVLPIDEDARGRHATTRRELFVLPSGALVIDTPGMRELGLVEDDGGLAAGFAEIEALARRCRFADCRHQGEPGCAVAAAIDAGEVEASRLAALHKLEREVQVAKARSDRSVAARSKQRAKALNVAYRARRKVDPKLQG